VAGGQAVYARLAGLGLVAGARIEIYRNDAHGPVILAHRHARIALGRGVAERVMVELAPVGRAGEGATDMRKSA
jgi:ferrous iron transport protein A